MKSVKLSKIVHLANELAYFDQELECTWMGKDYLKVNTALRKKVHTKLLKSLLALVNDGALEVDV